MFARFRSFMQDAVDVVAPQLKSRSDALLDHWQFIVGYFDGTRVLPTHIDETNISFHLVSIIKYIKEEEVEERETESGLTGPCMEEMLHRKMPDALVGWAIEDKLAGMYVQVLKTFSLLISNIHHRLLPEATVRLPLDRLITHANSLESHADLPKIKYELMKLINVVCRQFKLNPPLLNLFIEEDGSKTREKRVTKIPLLEITNAYIMFRDAETQQIARESILQLLELIFRDDRLTKYLMERHEISKIWIEQLISLYSTLPMLAAKSELASNNGVVLFDKDDQDAGSGGKRKPRRSSSPMRTNVLPTTISTFFSLWSFVNQVLNASSPSLEIIQQRGSPKKQMPDFPGKRFHSTLATTLLLEFIKPHVIPNILAKDPIQNVIAHSEYLAEMVSDVHTVQLLYGIVESALDFSTQSEYRHPREVFGPRLISKNDDLALATLRLFDGFLNTYNHLIYEKILFSELVSDSIDSAQVRNERIEELYTLAISPKFVSVQWSSDGVDTLSANISPNQGGFDEYFQVAEETIDPVIFAHKSWPADMKLIGPEETMNFLDIILEQFSNFYYNSPQKNLLLTKILKAIAIVPDNRVTSWFLQTSSRDGSKSPVQAGLKTFYDTLVKLEIEAAEIIKEIPDFQDKANLLKKYCGDDMLLILHNLSTVGSQDNLNQFEIKLHDRLDSDSLQQDLQSDVPAVTGGNSAVASPMGEGRPSFSVFLPAYLILTEFYKEITAALFVVEKTMQLTNALAKYVPQK